MLSEKTETNNPKNPTAEITNHQLTLDMAKEICMIQRSENCIVGKKIKGS